jgi:hypothetical protein
VWSPKGRELFFLDGFARLTAAQVQTAPTFGVTGVVRLFDAGRFVLDPFHQSYDLTPDGASFVFNSPRQQGARTTGLRLVWVNNWFTELQARLKQ